MPAKKESTTKTKTKSKAAGKKLRTKKTTRKKTQPNGETRVINRIAAPRVSTSGEGRKGKVTRSAPQYAFMKAPNSMHDFQVGKKIEVFCDHDEGKERVRGWIEGVIVQIDNKMVAVQFRSNVYLTDGWMVPDRILWYPLNSEHVRSVGGAKSGKKEKVIPDY